MNDYVLDLLRALIRMGRSARKPLIDRETDPVEWAGAMGQVLEDLEEAESCARAIAGIIAENQRRGTRAEREGQA
jgi:hypothetical protein